MDQLLYGTAYYEEYLPYYRLDQDVSMMKKARINLVRIAESTWVAQKYPKILPPSQICKIGQSAPCKQPCPIFCYPPSAIQRIFFRYLLNCSII